nr:MAG TPA: hypothetical protein [Caudoviricetes sp.]
MYGHESRDVGCDGRLEYVVCWHGIRAVRCVL